MSLGRSGDPVTALGLTRQQATALRFIGAYFAKNGYAPTYTEICVGCGMSPYSKSTMWYRLERLRARGYLLTQPRARQTIVLTQAGIDYCKSAPCEPPRSLPPIAYAAHGRRAGIHFRPVEGEA